MHILDLCQLTSCNLHDLSIEHLDFGLSFIHFSNTHLFVTYISLTLITWPLGGSGMTKQGTIILPQTDLNSPFLCSYACLQLRGVWPDAWNDHRRGVFTLTIASATWQLLHVMLHRGWSTHFYDIYSANQVISKSETYDSILPLFLVKNMSAIIVQSSCNVSHIVGFRCVGW